MLFKGFFLTCLLLVNFVTTALYFVSIIWYLVFGTWFRMLSIWSFVVCKFVCSEFQGLILYANSTCFGNMYKLTKVPLHFSLANL